jgi:hypothetical protein
MVFKFLMWREKICIIIIIKKKKKKNLENDVHASALTLQW